MRKIILDDFPPSGGRNSSVFAVRPPPVWLGSACDAFCCNSRIIILDDYAGMALGRPKMSPGEGRGAPEDKNWELHAPSRRWLGVSGASWSILRPRAAETPRLCCAAAAGLAWQRLRRVCELQTHLRCVCGAFASCKHILDVFATRLRAANASEMRLRCGKSS